MKTRTMIGIMAMGLLLSACSSLTRTRIEGSGKVVQEIREVSGFTQVELGGVGLVDIELGEKETLQIVAEDNLLCYLKTRVRGDTLELLIEEGVSLEPSEPIHYYLTVRELEAVRVFGLGQVVVPAIKADSFEIGISGSGHVDLAGIEADRLDVGLSGLGDLTVGNGRVDRLDVSISGSGGLEAGKVAAKEAHVDISGLGSASVWVADELNVNISGNGSVHYAGEPAVTMDVSGSGEVTRLD